MIRLLLILAFLGADYDRTDYGGWLVHSDCMNTRAKVLVRDSIDHVNFDESGCRVVKGLWISEYSTKMHSEASELDIDHVVPLAHADKMGAHKWSEARKKRFANDMTNLVVTESSVNRSKGSQDPSTWIPLDPRKWCEYGDRWLRVKEKYSLLLSAKEARAIYKLLRKCTEE